MQEFVRAGVIDDLDRVVALERLHRDALASTPRGGPQWLDEHPSVGPQGWRRRFDDPSWICLVSGLDDVVLGFASARLEGAIATVETIFVESEARALGLGESMLDMIVDRCRNRGASRVDATALPGDRETKNLFERAGLIARLIVVSRALPE